MNPIKKFVVRIDGSLVWSQHQSERAAHKSCRVAREENPGMHCGVYAIHADGAMTGPYTPAKGSL